MRSSRLLVALSVVALTTAAAPSSALAGNEGPYGILRMLANEGPYGARVAANEGPYGSEFAAKCLLHWTATCDAAFGIDAAHARAPISPNGEGLPLPWPFPW
ncbi:MAG: hypothetical protein HY834_11610 [Devosia nanyangense]|uniref:Uncharacterized protein n=1 Tax=Devosia nanyangense TaxID=1228055 RepID=A0A933NZ60_9HYPH|nr:hypothetical protein [Devosia nanyangense]